MDDEKDLGDIFRVLWKRRLLIISIFVVAVLVAGALSFVSPIRDKEGLMMAIAGILGLIIGILAASVREGLGRMAE